ncbi:MAG: hypothetical protein AAF318_11660 [Pseudomonadota bacterium]
MDQPINAPSQAAIAEALQAIEASHPHLDPATQRRWAVWRVENRPWIEEYNERLAREGLWVEPEWLNEDVTNS